MGWGAISVPHPRSRKCLAHQDTVAQKKTTLLLRFLSTPAGADRGFQSGGGEIFEEQKKIKIGTILAPPLRENQTKNVPTC